MKLKKYKNNNKRKPYILIIIGFLLLFISTYLFYKSYALYEENKNFDVINGNVEDPGDIYFAYYIDGEVSRNMPTQNTGYTLDDEKSNCTNGVKITWNHSTWQGVTDYTNYNANTNTRTKCTLYFNKNLKTVSTVLGNIEVNSYTPDFTKSACDDSSCESHEKGIYETTDYDGNSTYYYRGSVENNYVKFAGIYWRIIRINSNGSIRMIYDGTSAHENGESSEDRQYGVSAFNDNHLNVAYLGYMYTLDEAHGTSISSTIKILNDNFYKYYIQNMSLFLDTNVGFCGDRSTLNEQLNVGIDTNVTYMKGYLRVLQSLPSLICENSNDYYTMQNSAIGNKALSYPIGLISIDEVMLAGQAGGIFNGTYNLSKYNLNGYIITGNPFWTMTPAGYYYPYSNADLGSHMFLLHGNGMYDDNYVVDKVGYRPVINISSDVSTTGNGTMTDPYVVN